MDVAPAKAASARSGLRAGGVPGPVWAGGTKAGRAGERGLTLIELIVTVAILSILASAAIPVARFQVKREKERDSGTTYG